MFIRYRKRPFQFILLAIGILFVLSSIIQIKAVYSEGERKDGLIIAGFVPFYWMILLVGGLIILTLGYVSIRKYFGQKRRIKKNRQRK